MFPEVAQCRYDATAVMWDGSTERPVCTIHYHKGRAVDWTVYSGEASR